jgi:hypothetical protein
VITFIKMRVRMGKELIKKKFERAIGYGSLRQKRRNRKLIWILKSDKVELEQL